MYLGCARGDFYRADEWQKQEISLDDSRDARGALRQIDVSGGAYLDQAGHGRITAGDGGYVRVSDESFHGADDKGVLNYTKQRICIIKFTDQKKCSRAANSKKRLNMEVFSRFFYTSNR